MSHEVLRGELGVRKKKGTEQRFFVLFEDRLDYFAVEADADGGENPRGRIHLKEVTSIDEVDGDLVFQVQTGSQWCIRPPGEASLQLWSSALQRLIVPPDPYDGGVSKPEPAPEASPREVRSRVAPMGNLLCQGNLEVLRKGEFVQRYLVLCEDALFYYEQASDWEKREDPRGLCVLSDVLTVSVTDRGFTLQMTKPAKPLELRAPTEEEATRWLRELSILLRPRLGDAFAERQPLQPSVGDEQPSRASIDPLHAGELEHVKSGKVETRYFVLLPDRLEYFSTYQDFVGGSAPRGQIALSDVRGVQIGDLDITVELLERKFVLRALGERPASVVQAWGTAWEQALLAGARSSGGDAVRVRWEQTGEAPRLESAVHGGRTEEEAEDGLKNTQALAIARRDGGGALHVRWGNEREVPQLESVSPWGRAEEKVAEDDELEHAKAEVPADPVEPAREEGANAAGQPATANTVDGAVGAIHGMLRRRSLRATNLFRDLRYKPPGTSSGQTLLDEHGIKGICSDAGLALSMEDSKKVLQTLDTAGKGKVDLRDLETALRRHSRAQAKQEQDSRNRRKMPHPLSRREAEERQQQALAGDIAERSKAKLRSVGYSCGGVKWSKVFALYARRDNGTIDLHNFISMVRRDAKITYREMPDALLEQVFATIDASQTGNINYSEFVSWLGVREEADREKREDEAATQIQALQRGRRARQRVSVLKARGPHVLRRGSFLVELRDGTVESRMVIVYEDHMEFFGKTRGYRITSGDIEDLAVKDTSFILNLRGGVQLRLQATSEICIEEWMDTFSRLCAGGQDGLEVQPCADWEEEVPWSSDDEEPSASLTSLASTAASATGSAQRNRRNFDYPGNPKPKRSGELAIKISSNNGRVDKAQLIELFHTNPGLAAFLGLPNHPPCMLEDTVRQIGAGGRQDISLDELISSCTPAEAGAASRAATPRKLDRSPSPRGLPRNTPSPRPRRPAELCPIPMELLAGISQVQVSRWLSSLQDPPIHCGVLGFQESGRVVMRYAVLFQDRLDSWDSAADAVGGHLPRNRIAHCEVGSIEMVRGGFILNCKGRRTTLHLANDGDVRAWSGALHSLLPVHFLAVGSAFCKHQADAPKKRARSASSRPSSFVPRCANVQASPRQASPDFGRRVTMIMSARNVQRDAVRINTHRDGLQAARLLHGMEAVTRARPAWPGPEVSGKVNERACSLERPVVVAAKVTGWERHVARPPDGASPSGGKVTGDRSLTPRREPPVSRKITGETPEQKPPSGHGITGKITGDRQRSLTPRRELHGASTGPCPGSPVATKITDRGREAPGWAAQGRAAALDRMRPMGSPPKSGPQLEHVLF